MASMQPVSAVGANSASHPYTCNTCQVAYRNIDLQKGHMKSDWHRYNLKRRVASLPPISSEVFTEKVLQARAVSTAEADKAYFERSCEICNKTYYSENAYQNHLLSQKHKLNEGTVTHPTDETTSVISSTFSLGEPTPAPRRRLDSDVEDGIKDLALTEEKPQKEELSAPQPQAASTADADGASVARESNSATPVQAAAEPAWSLQTCVVCNYDSPSLPLNITHMERIHGMFIPERNYVADLEGLVNHLHRKVREFHECLFCGKFKANIFAVQTHMRDTGHCKIPYTTEEEQLEIGDYYDFRSTYSDGGASDDDSAEEDQGGAKLSRRPRGPKGGDEDGSAGEEDGWETDSSASSLDSEDLTAVPAEGHLHQFERLSKHPHHSRNDPRLHRQVDGFHSHAHKHTHAVFHDDYELHLPSGKSVGHRSLNKYYRQNLTHYPTPEERAERLAIEGSSDAEDDDDRQVAVRNGGRRGRDLVPRGVAGLAGVSEQKKEGVRRAEQHGRSLETVTAKRKDYAYGKKLNNYKGYYYRYQGGG